MERTMMKDGIVNVGEKEFTRLVEGLVGTYKFMNKGESPTKVIFPLITGVDSVEVAFEPIEEVLNATGS